MTQRLDLLIKKLIRLQDKSGSYKSKLFLNDEIDIITHLRNYEHFIDQRLETGISRKNGNK